MSTDVNNRLKKVLVGANNSSKNIAVGESNSQSNPANKDSNYKSISTRCHKFPTNTMPCHLKV